MSHNNSSNNAVAFLYENSIFLIAGAIIALGWANYSNDTYEHFINFEFKHLFYDEDPAHAEHGVGHGKEDHAEHDHAKHDDGEDHKEEGSDDSENQTEANGESEPDADEPDAEKPDADEPDADKPDADKKSEPDEANHDEDGDNHDGKGETKAATSLATDGHGSSGDGHDDHGHQHPFDIKFFINDILMALFFAIAGKEVWEALLPGGALSKPRKAATPLLATAGGVLGPALVYLAGVYFTGHWDTLARGWAIPCATDIAFSYLVARIIFGNGHPAIAFLLLLAIADDAAGLIILAVAYSDSAGLSQYAWLGLTVIAILIGYSFRWLKLQSFWWYLLIPGVLSWVSFWKAGIHPALGLVPIIPTLPHAHTDLGLFAKMELKRPDTLNAFEHWWKNPVEIILGLFGLVNAGVVMSAAGAGTLWVLAGLLVGKPVGILLFTLFGDKVFKLEIPKGMNYRHITAIGFIAAIGFTVALFVSTVAFRGPEMKATLDSVKMGALGSFGAAFIAIIVARILGIKPLKPGETIGDEKDPQRASTDW